MARSVDLKSEGPARHLVEAMVGAFAKAWESVGTLQNAPQLSAYLPPTSEPRPATLLQELIAIDLKNRWQRGQPAYLEQYLERFPELGNRQSVPAQLIREEYRARQSFG